MTESAASMRANVFSPAPATNAANAANATSRPRIVSIPENRVADIIELSSSSFSIEEDDERKPRALDDKQFAASEMYERVVSRGRGELTSLVKNRNNRTEKENSAKKRLKTTLKTLQKEKDNDGHIATILDVTSNGNDLIGSPMIDSQDCLDLVMELYQD